MPRRRTDAAIADRMPSVGAHRARDRARRLHRGRRGHREDTTGPLIVEWLRARGFDAASAIVVADADIAAALRRCRGCRPRV